MAEVIETEHPPVPEHPEPDQPMNCEPAAGVAVSCTFALALNEAEQVEPQSMPASGRTAADLELERVAAAVRSRPENHHRSTRASWMVDGVSFFEFDDGTYAAMAPLARDRDMDFGTPPNGSPPVVVHEPISGNGGYRTDASTIVTASMDTFVFSSLPTTNYGTSNTLKVGHIDSSNMFALVQASGISITGTITSAYLELYLNGGCGGASWMPRIFGPSPGTMRSP